MSGTQGPRQFTGITFLDKRIAGVVEFFDPTSRVCKLPGCNKLCYVENDGYVHDFCGRSHALEHKAMKDEAERQKMLQRQQKARGQHGNGVGHHTSQGGVGGGCQCMSGVGTSHLVAGDTYYGTDMVNQNFMQPSNVGPGPALNMVNQPANFGMVNQPGLLVPGPIRFYNRDDPYYEFTNFFPAEIFLDGKRWPTTEHYFQAQKFIGTPFTEMIRNFERPREAFDLSRNPAVSRWCRKDWNEVKIKVMRKALLAKFTQHKDLRNLLLGTKDNMLIEHSPYDKFWGNGGDDSGENHLGMLLMEIRSDLFRSRRVGSDVNSVESTKHQQPSPKVCRETVQGSSGGVENGSASQNSSSSMDYSDPETNRDGVNLQHNRGEIHRPLKQHVEDENGGNLTRSELQGSPTQTDASVRQVVDGEVEVASLIDFRDNKPEKTKIDSLIMAENTCTTEILQPVIQLMPATSPITSFIGAGTETGQVAGTQTTTGDTEDMETTLTGGVAEGTVVPDQPTQPQPDSANDDSNDTDPQGEDEKMETNDNIH